MAGETATIQNAMLGGWGNTAADYSKEIAAVTRDLNTPGAITNMQDRLNAQSYLAQLTGSNPGNAGKGVLAANQPYSAPIPGAPDTGDATGGAGNQRRPGLFPDYGAPMDDSMLRPGEAQSMGAGGDNVFDWLKNRLGDIGVVVLGVIVIGVALVAATKSNQKMVIEAVKGAVS